MRNAAYSPSSLIPRRRAYLPGDLCASAPGPGIRRIVSSDGKKLHIQKGMGHVAEVFEAAAGAATGESAIGHVRYSTAGESALSNAQPILVDCWRGPLALAHNGNLINAGTSAPRTRARRRHLSFHQRQRSDSASAVPLEAAARLQEAFVEALRIVQGAFSLVVLTPECLLVARDPRGFRPLCIGRVDGRYVFASETCAFDLINAEYIRDVEPGEVLRVKETPWNHSCRFPKERPAYCVFEHIYFSRPDSLVFGRTVNTSRQLLGKFLAREHPADADVVVPVPDSGVSAALGYSQRERHPA